MSGPDVTPAVWVGTGRPLPRMGGQDTVTIPSDRLGRSRHSCSSPCGSTFLAAAHICIIALLAGCGTTALKPEPKLVSSVTSLPPVQVPVPVRCVKEIPPIPKVTIDPNATVLQRYYAMRELIAAQDEYVIRANAALIACAAEPPK